MKYDSIVRLMGDVPLTPSYNDTFAFATQDEQNSYFQGKTAQTFSTLMYVKSNGQAGWVDLPVAQSQYRRFNYLSYRNPDYPGKWFYAFIVGTEYKSDTTTRFYLQDDPIQTWLYEILPEMTKTFIIRQHIPKSDDRIGYNLIDEGLSVGDYVAAETIHAKIDQWWIVVASTIDLQGFDDSVGGMFARVYSGLSFRIFDAMTESGVAELNNALNAVAKAGKLDSIVTIYMVPKIIIEGGSSGGAMPPGTLQFTTPIPNGDSLNGYHPKNNKLFTYPYVGFRITNYSGQSQILKYEWLQSNDLVVGGSPMPDGRVLIWPAKYKYVENNFDYAVAVGEYPQCSWIKDVYSNWLATQEVKWQYADDRRDTRANFGVAQSLIGGASQIGMSQIPEANIAAGVSSAVGAAGNLLGNLMQNHLDELDMKSRMAEDSEIMNMNPPAYGGTVGNGSTLISIGNYGYRLERITISAEYAMSIDNYFTMNGYKLMRFDDVRIFGRSSFNYVKTMNVTINGAAPQSAKHMFERVLNAGCRFWHIPALGDYSVENN